MSADVELTSSGSFQPEQPCGRYWAMIASEGDMQCGREAGKFVDVCSPDFCAQVGKLSLGEQ